MRNLIVSGDSFTLGSELAGKSWAEILGTELRYNTINKAVAGAGNATIARTIIEEIPANCAVTVMWTFLARYDLYTDNKWKTFTAHNSDAFEKDFYKSIGDSEFYELHNSLTNILLLQNLLEKYQIPYFFTSADSSWHDMHYTKDKWISKLMSLIDWSKWYEIYNGQGFYKWGSAFYDCGKFGHPLDQAHVDLVKDIKPFAESLIGFSD